MNIVRVLLSIVVNCGNNSDEILSLKKALHDSFAIKDLGNLKYFLGIEIDHSSHGLFLNQHKYVIDLLEETEMTDCKPAKTPLSSKIDWTPKLLLFTIQFMHSPNSYHLGIVKRILRYLKGSLSRGIAMQKNDHFQIVGYSDSDWAGNSLDRTSTTRYCTFVGGNLVTWKSKKQSVVA
ncbi:uncharacterized mitochondrial protein AtMg00810-like [Argentina anserina]|uniref:uncharacterized mitochondrial protein AtMg00810-like n=1 Tax=Argentina anserina TaxID=57926 RepID=UPI00217681C0|nr:uncharacterized mitochondrial protein AtMg00810-like [Potentilla anserina]